MSGVASDNGGTLELRVIQVSGSKDVVRQTKEVLGGLVRIPAKLAVTVFGAVNEAVHLWVATPDKPVFLLKPQASLELPAADSERDLVLQDEHFRRGFRMAADQRALSACGVSLYD